MSDQRLLRIFGASAGGGGAEATPGLTRTFVDEGIDDATFASLTRSYLTSDARQALKQASLIERLGDEPDSRAASLFKSACYDPYSMGFLAVCKEAFFESNGGGIKKNAADNLTEFEACADHDSRLRGDASLFDSGMNDARHAIRSADPVSAATAWLIQRHV